MATKMIQDKVRRLGLSDILGEHGDINVQGERQQKLDVYSNEVLIHFLGQRDSVGILAVIEHSNFWQKCAARFEPGLLYQAIGFSPVNVPVLEPNASVSMPSCWSMLTYRFASG